MVCYFLYQEYHVSIMEVNGDKPKERNRKVIDSLRPEFTKPMPNDLTKYIKKLISIRNQSSALQKGEFKELVFNK